MKIIEGILIAIACSLFAFILHVAAGLLRKGRRADEPVIFELSRQVRAALYAWCAAFVLLAIFFFHPPVLIISLAAWLNRLSGLTGYIYGAMVYVFLCFTYLTVYYLVDRSVSSTLLEIIENSPEGRLSAGQVKEIYNVENKYRSELRCMRDGGFIVEESGYYRNTLKGRIYSRLARLVKIILKLGPGG
jgi:hypothetical protein